MDRARAFPRSTLLSVGLTGVVVLCYSFYRRRRRHTRASTHRATPVATPRHSIEESSRPSPRTSPRSPREAISRGGDETSRAEEDMGLELEECMAETTTSEAGSGCAYCDSGEAHGDCPERPIKCEYHRWCNFEAKAHYLSIHIKQCEKSTLVCDMCGYETVASDIFSHIHVCVERPVHCRFCITEVPSRTLKAHEDKCDRRPIACQYCHLGFTKTQLKSHQSDCPDQPEPCQFCTSSTTTKRTVKAHEKRCMQRLVPCKKCDVQIVAANVPYHACRSRLKKLNRNTSQSVPLSPRSSVGSSVSSPLSLSMGDIFFATPPADADLNGDHLHSDLPSAVTTAIPSVSRSLSGSFSGAPLKEGGTQAQAQASLRPHDLLAGVSAALTKVKEGE